MSLKKEIIKEASLNPEKFFPIKVLKKYGFERMKCKKCSLYFWSTKKREICGDTSCVEKYDFIKQKSNFKMEYEEVYKFFSDFMKKKGYEKVKRFPVVARWRNDLEFNIASIIGFQPYVTKGISKPPFNKLTIPQNCLRFNDIENVGFTGRHGSHFIMIGQCVFLPKEKFEQEKYFEDLLLWFLEIMKIEKGELQIHEDAWLGGGDCGPSLEFFSKGVELANQVYMTYDMNGVKKFEDLKPLKLKVLDMGMGLERCCWYSKGDLNQYESCMPRIIKYLLEKTKVKVDKNLTEKFFKLSGLLDFEEEDTLENNWNIIAEKLNEKVKTLKEKIEPIARIYAIADHTRTLLFSLCDGALPSNVKGGYNLRIILRRMLNFIKKFKWDLDVFQIIKLQYEEVKKIYDDLTFDEKNIKKVIELEIQKYERTKEKIKNKLSSIVSKKLEIKDFISYYITQGISPYDIQDYANEKNIKVEIPKNFLKHISEYFLKDRKEKNQIEDFEKHLENLPDTKLIFYEDVKKYEEEVKILKEFSTSKKKYIVLDKTIFYPKMGGQDCDLGFIGNKKVLNVSKIKNIVLHEVE